MLLWTGSLLFWIKDRAWYEFHKHVYLRDYSLWLQRICSFFGLDEGKAVDTLFLLFLLFHLQFILFVTICSNGHSFMLFSDAVFTFFHGHIMMDFLVNALQWYKLIRVRKIVLSSLQLDSASKNEPTLDFNYNLNLFCELIASPNTPSVSCLIL